MNARLTPIQLVMAALMAIAGIYDSAAGTRAAVQAPVLKWQHGGCYSSWCETGRYSSRLVAYLDEDGKPEVIGATYSLYVVNGENGSLHGRGWPGVVVAVVPCFR